MTNPEVIKTINEKNIETKELTQSQKKKFIICLDSTQIDRFKRCNEEWNLSDRQQLELKPSPYIDEKKKLKMGILGHKYLESYYKARSVGTIFPAAMNNALRLDYTANEDTKTLSLDDAKRIKDRTALYLQLNNASGNELIVKSPDHVEIGFSELLYEDSERLYILEGRIDLLTSIQGIDCIVDHKYQFSSSDLYKKSIQFRNYSMVSRMTTLVINYIRLMQNVTPDTFKRDFASFSFYEHNEWRARLIQTYNKVFNVMAYENNLFDRNESACSGKYGSPCEFIQLCEELNYAQRETKKSALYQIKKEFRPW